MVSDRSRGLRVWAVAGGFMAIVLAAPAQATTGLSSLAGLQAVLYVMLAGLAVVWVLALLGIRTAIRRRGGHTARVGRPGLPRLPMGLRLLAWAQHLLAFVWASIAIVMLVFPSQHLNGSIHPDVWHTIVFGFGFAVLAVLSAFGYVLRSTAFGFRAGIALGWLCVLDPLFVAAWRGGAFAVHDRLTPVFGVVLLLVLGLAYRRHFGFERRIWTRRRLGWAARLGLIGAALFIAFGGTSWVVTTRDFDMAGARGTLSDLATIIEAYHAEHGRWPADLEELGVPHPTHFGWARIEYDPEQLRLALPVEIPEKADLAYRLSFGVLGDFLGTTEIGRRLRDQPAGGSGAEEARS